MNPNLHPAQRHGSMWFEVSGFGRVRRDFTVNHPDLLANNPKKLARKIAKQIMLLDRDLPKKEHLCQAVMVDIIGAGHRRVYDMASFDILLQQQL